MNGERAENSYGLLVDVVPFTTSDDNSGGYGVSVVMLHIVEKIGGEVAFGDMELCISRRSQMDLVLNEINKINTATIKIRDKGKTGISYTIPIFITARNSNFNVISIKFVCIPDIKFLTDYHELKFDDVTSALNALYPGKKIIRTSCDVDNNTELHQCTETDYEFCSRLAQSYKHESIFAFGWEGLLIKDLCGIDSCGNNEPYIEITDKEYRMTAPVQKKFDKALNSVPRDLWDNTELESIRPRFVTSSVSRENYRIQHRDFSKLMDNYYYNGRILGGTMYSMFYTKIFRMPGFKLGDVVLYTRKETTDRTVTRKFLCAMNELFFSTNEASKTDSDGFKFSWKSAFLGLDRGAWSGEEQQDELTLNQ